MEHHKTAEAEYFGLAKAWDEELYESLKKSRKLAWGVAVASMVVAAMAVAAVLMLTPLKTSEPFVFMVDKTTGYAESVRKLEYSNTQPITTNELVVSANLVDYVTNRETFDATDQQDRYEQVNRTSDGPIFKAYSVKLTGDINRLNKASKRFVTIKSVSPDIATKTASVRFKTDFTNFNQVTTEHWIATISYDFKDLNIPMRDRWKNPLGFIVTNYRVNVENL